MEVYATIEQLEAGFRELTDNEKTAANSLIEEAAAIIDAYNNKAEKDAKRIVTCRMVRRAIGDGGDAIPMGATQGSLSALGYSQSWTINGGTSGEVYISKAEKTILGVGNRIGASNPFADDTEAEA